MPWNLIVTGGALALLLAAWLFQRRRSPSMIGPVPDVGQPPVGAQPMVEPRLLDTGLAAYELPLTPPDADPDDSPA